MGAIDGAPKELRKLLVTAQNQGCTVTLTGSRHFQVRTPNGGVTHVSQTPRNIGNVVKNVRRDLKKLGVTV